jgi:dipeptidyl aminopeptidase/acylaminoacyl peptidase
MLNDGSFLLRDRNNLEIGNIALELKPFLHFPGPLDWLEMDPAHQYLVTDSREPVAADKPGGGSDTVVRILRRDSGKVVLVSRAPAAVHLPINSDGYLQSQRANGDQWLLNLNYFSGGSHILGQVDSSCAPLLNFVAPQELLLTVCTPTGGRELVAMTTDGRRLWEAQTSEEAVWPLVVRSPDGSRLAREALAITHPISAYAPLNQEDIKGQLVEILNSVDGKVVLAAAASPILDAGGNIAISPSGRRVAVLNGSAIQVFELPAPTPFPDTAAHPPGN